MPWPRLMESMDFCGVTTLNPKCQFFTFFTHFVHGQLWTKGIYIIDEWKDNQTSQPLQRSFSFLIMLVNLNGLLFSYLPLLHLKKPTPFALYGPAEYVNVL